MNFLNLLMHASSVLKAVQAIESIGLACVKEKRRPSNDEDKIVIEAFESLLVAGLVPLPAGIPEGIDKALEDVKAML